MTTSIRFRIKAIMTLKYHVIVMAGGEKVKHFVALSCGGEKRTDRFDFDGYLQ